MSTTDDVRRIQLLFKLANTDPQYREMANQYQMLERQFGDLVQGMSIDEQDIAWGFVCLSDEMNLRLIEVLCNQFDIDLLHIDLGQ